MASQCLTTLTITVLKASPLPGRTQACRVELQQPADSRPRGAQRHIPLEDNQSGRVLDSTSPSGLLTQSAVGRPPERSDAGSAVPSRYRRDRPRTCAFPPDLSRPPPPGSPRSKSVAAATAAARPAGAMQPPSAMSSNGGASRHAGNPFAGRNGPHTGRHPGTSQQQQAVSLVGTGLVHERASFELTDEDVEAIRLRFQSGLCVDALPNAGTHLCNLLQTLHEGPWSQIEGCLTCAPR